MYPIFKTVLFALILFAAFLVLFRNLFRLYNFMTAGKPENRFDRMGERFEQLMKIAIGQSKILRDKIAGPIHTGIFWGFMVLLFSASEAVLQGFFHEFSWSYLGPLYTVISFTTDIFCVIVIVSVIAALYRRFVSKVARLQGDRHERTDAIIVLCSILVIVASLLLESSAGTVLMPAHEWAFKPVSQFLGNMIPLSAAAYIYEFFWWLHIIAILAFMNYLPFSKHLHVYTSLPNVLFGTIGPVNKLKPIDFEQEAEKFGVVDVEDLTWKQILDSYTCTHCGRCDTVCPANTTGKILSPRDIIIQIRNRTLEKGPVLLRQDKAGEKDATGEFELKIGEQEILNKKFIGDYQNIEALWQCTTCGACMKECPVAIEHVPAIVDMRRSLVMMEANFPTELQPSYGSLENNATPWAFPPSERADWAQGLNIKTAAENPEFDVLFWVGCAGSFDDRAKKISRAFSRLMQIAGVDFAILGTEEQCNGDVARRTGNEYLAQMLIKGNVETMAKYRFNKVVTFCPHCFNIIKNEYPDFGGKYEVVHHSQLLMELIKLGKLNVPEKMTDGLKIAYHDSCYLGRYNDIYEQPRDILGKIKGLEILEPPRSKDRGMCCGAGGGQMFMEEKQGKRVNIERTEELLATGCSSIAVNCPFCMTMITDGTKAKDKEEVKVKDIAEILLEHIES